MSRSSALKPFGVGKVEMWFCFFFHAAWAVGNAYASTPRLVLKINTSPMSLTGLFWLKWLNILNWFTKRQTPKTCVELAHDWNCTGVYAIARPAASVLSHCMHIFQTISSAKLPNHYPKITSFLLTGLFLSNSTPLSPTKPHSQACNNKHARMDHNHRKRNSSHPKVLWVSLSCVWESASLFHQRLSILSFNWFNDWPS